MINIIILTIAFKLTIYISLLIAATISTSLTPVVLPNTESLCGISAKFVGALSQHDDLVLRLGILPAAENQEMGSDSGTGMAKS